jgi:hypothetical protein
MAGYVERDEYSERAKLVGNELDSALASLVDEAYEHMHNREERALDNTYRAIYALEGVLTVFDSIAEHIE